MWSKQVVEPLENAIKAVDGIEGVTSTASEGNAIVMASFDFGDEGTKQLVADIQQAVNRARSQLPEGVDPQVVAGSTDDIPAVVLAVTSDKDQQALADQLDHTVVPALEDIEGVGQVAISGVQDMQVSVVPDDQKLAAAGLSPASVSQALQAAGGTMAAGSFAESGESRTIQVGGGFTSLRQIEDVRIVPGAATGKPGKPVRLGDVATVKQEEATPVSITRTNGKPSLAVAATMDKDGSAVAISDAVEKILPDLRKDLGAGAELTVVTDQGPAVSKAISGLTIEGALGLLFAVVVILIFLASIRSTLVTAVSIPLSVVLALIVLWTRDLSLNMLTLGALTIAIGRVVDDSIVVLENIKRHLGYGEERQSAIVAAVKEVAGAVTASTLTTVAVFLPIGLVGGMVGQLFGSFSLTVTAALLASLLVSLTVVPVLSYWFLRAPKGTDENPDQARRKAEEKEAASRLQRIYVPVLGFATRRRVTSVVIALVILLGTFGMAPLLKTTLFDEGEQEVISLTQELAPGTSLDAADEAARKVEKVITADKSVKDYQVTVGSSGFLAAFGGSTGANQASYQITLKDAGDYDAAQKRIEEGLAKLDGIGQTSIAAGGGFGSQDLSVVVKAADPDVLRKASEEVRAEVKKLDGVTDVQSDLSQSVPRISVRANDKAAAAGFDQTTLGALVTGAVGGTKSGKAMLDDTERDVVVKSATPATTMAQLEDLKVGTVRLSQIADVEVVDGPVSMTRIDGQRAATITARPTDEDTGGVSQELTKKLDALDLPEGATATIGGVSADQSDAYTALPRHAGGRRDRLHAAGGDLPFADPADDPAGFHPVRGHRRDRSAARHRHPDGRPGDDRHADAHRHRGHERDRADRPDQPVQVPGHGCRRGGRRGGRHRLRPILMTALATIFALLPMALGITGEGGLISQPLAVVVIGGLITSTLLTLLLVPTLYAMVELGKERRAEKRAAKREAKGQVPAQSDSGTDGSREAAHSGV